MSAIIPFQFEAHAVRVQVDELGLPWFNASDICSILEFGNPRQAIESHVDTDDVQKLDTIDNIGRTQRANHVNESGLYALILGSTKDAAKRFKRWVTSEVLPAIRKTGGYAAPGTLPALPAPTQDRVTSLLLIGEAVARVPGVKPGMAMAATLNAIETNVGLAIEVFRKALPALETNVCSLNATQLGERVGLSAQAVNQHLATLGHLVKNERNEWELTKTGEGLGEAFPFTRRGHSGYQILWDPAVVDLIKTSLCTVH